MYFVEIHTYLNKNEVEIMKERRKYMLFNKSKYKIIMMIILAMLLQIAAPVAEYVYAEVMNGEGGETVTEAVYIPSEMISFSLVVNGIDLATADETTIEALELEQKQEAKFTIVFNVNLENDTYLYKAGDYFEFDFPTAIKDFGNLSGYTSPAVGEPKFSYKYEGGKVKVYLSEDLDPLNHDISNEVIVTLNFSSEFGFSGDDLEQEIEIPTPGQAGGTKTIKLTFKPKTKDEKMSKESLGVTIIDGERYIDWVIWVNKAGKDLNNAKITDVPSSKPAHIIVENSVNVARYDIGLSGVIDEMGAGTTVSTDTNFPINSLTGKYAYKITYRTKVIEDSPSGPQEFKNTATLTSPGFTTETFTGFQSITYGEALEKIQNSGDNYVSNWEIRYNYNLASIPKPGDNKFNIVDNLSGPHNIDTSSIKVYKMSTDANGNVVDTGTEIGGLSGGENPNGPSYTIIPVQDGENNVKGFNLKFDGSVTAAYKITYTAKYGKEFYEGESGTVKNEVNAGIHTDTKSYPVGQNILRKSHTLDLANQELTWTITIKADNADITNLTLTDVFASKDTVTGMGEQRLEGNITITGTTSGNPTIEISKDSEGNPTEGFTISGINITKGKTATITYKTKYAVGEDGKVASEYKNTATATWTKDSIDYSIEVSDSYKPQATTTNNGRKEGSYNYSTQTFTWGIIVNFNKKDIQGAILTDNLGPGHDIVADSLKIYNFTPSGSDDTKGTKGDLSNLIAGTDYTVSYNATNGKSTGYTLTFKSDLESGKNNKAYYIEYETRDSDNIIGLSRDEQTGQASKDQGKYTNTATFKTKDTTTHTLESKPVTVKDANHLISKGVESNSTKETLTWTIEINKSLSDIGEVTLTDKPSENLMLIPDTIEVQEMISVNNYNGKITYSSWTKPNPAPTIDNEEGSFTLALGNLSKKAVQVRYETLVLGKQGDNYSNSATIEYAGSSQGNDGGESGSEKKDKFQFSSSDATSSSKKGNVKFKKVGYDNATENKVGLGNVEFQLIKKIGNNHYIIREATSEENGEFVFNSVGYGTYLIREVSVPTGYIKMEDEPFTMGTDTDIKLSGNEAKVIELTNTKINQGFKLTKIDEKEPSIKLAGVEFELFKHDGIPVTKDRNENDIIGKLTTDVNGVILIDDLPTGKYYLKEIKAPEGYWLDEGHIEFEIKAENIEIIDLGNITNTKQGDLIVKKIDKDNNNSLPGAEFTLYDNSKNIIATATTNADGIAKFTNIKYGSYILNETKAPSGYVGYSEDINITIALPEQEEVVQNEKIHQAVELTKVDESDANIRLSGAVFELYKTDGTHVKQNEKGEDIGDEGRISTNIDGKISINNLEPDEYYFKEVKSSEYYLLPENYTISFKIEENQTTITSVTAKNTRGEGNIILTKVGVVEGEPDTKTPLEGVEFTLKKGDTVIASGTTKADGTLAFNNLPYDTYTILETKALDEYVPNTTSITVVLDGEGTNGKEVTVGPIENIKKDYSVKLTKYNWNKSEVLKDAIFELRKEGLDGEYEVVEGIDVEDLTTDENGEIHLENLEAGSYQLIETKAPAGYRLDKTPVEFEINENQIEPTKVEKINYRIPPVDPDPGPGPGPKPDPEKPTEPPTSPEEPTVPTEPVEPTVPTDPEEPTIPEEQPTVKEETPKETPKEGEVEVPEGSDPKVKNPPENGTVTIDEDGRWKYTPNPGFVGKDRFTIIIKHPDGTEEEIFIEIDVEDVPLGTVLPKTGEGSKLGYYLTGLLLVLLGVFLRRKTI